MAVCQVCFRHCELSEGQTGFCGGRKCVGGEIVAKNYGRITSLALDPIEKKPLRRFYPDSKILSLGSYGCNLRCPFCQNHEISWSAQAMSFEHTARSCSPEDILRTAEAYRNEGNIGVAFTYNEPLIGYEFVRDTARLVHNAGMKNVLVTNGTAELSVLHELAPYIDAMNIDLKGFTEHYYSKVLGGNLDMTLAFIKEAHRTAHIELTTLIVPEENDTEEEMRRISQWIAELDPNIPLHISRFFPRFHMTDRKATDVSLIYRLADAARERLRFVYTGNC